MRQPGAPPRCSPPSLHRPHVTLLLLPLPPHAPSCPGPQSGGEVGRAGRYTWRNPRVPSVPDTSGTTLLPLALRHHAPWREAWPQAPPSLRLSGTTHPHPLRHHTPSLADRCCRAVRSMPLHLSLSHAEAGQLRASEPVRDDARCWLAGWLAGKKSQHKLNVQTASGERSAASIPLFDMVPTTYNPGIHPSPPRQRPAVLLGKLTLENRLLKIQLLDIRKGVQNWGL